MSFMIDPRFSRCASLARRVNPGIGFAQKVHHRVRTASGSDRPNAQLFGAQPETEINARSKQQFSDESLAGRYRFRF
jgi:hypothetical protein